MPNRVDFLQSVVQDILNENSTEKNNTITNYETMEKVPEVEKYSLQYGIVGIDDSGILKYGYFTSILIKNIRVRLDNDDTVYALSADCLKGSEYTFIYDNRIGFYKIISTKSISKQDLILLSDSRGMGNFPYNINRNYECDSYLDTFKETCTVNTESPKWTSVLKYTSGIEYETSAGYIPQELCYKNGLIPLRDGSISGIEYASTVMDKNNIIQLVRQQTEVLRKYCSFDNECSIHFHFGNYPINDKAIFTLYVICQKLQRSLLRYIPENSFSTHRFKRSGKNYCANLPKMDTFEDLYHWLSTVDDFGFKNLKQPHPKDPDETSKWRVTSRYHWLNLIHMCFYNNRKTCEFRFVRPTFNENKIIFWLYAFNAILKFSEDVSKKINKCNIDTIQSYIKRSYNINLSSTKIDLKDIIGVVYKGNLRDSLFNELEKHRMVTNMYYRCGDYTGTNFKLEDAIFNTPLL